MSQSGLVSRDNKGMSKADGVMKLKVTVPRFDNSALIQGYARTLIGRCMNPSVQEMKNLLYMLPRIWKVEERVVGADLGLGRFQFDFDNEEDIDEVMKMAPFHFDYWMLSVVRWEPVVDRNYPSVITFWIRVMGVPLHFWAEQTFKSIGEALGEYQGVDLDNGMVQVTVDGFKPLIFETTVEFHSGEETVVSLWYERLFGYCRRCFSLCYDETKCFGDHEVEVAGGMIGGIGGSGSSKDPKMLSYKAVASQDPPTRQNSDRLPATRAQSNAIPERYNRIHNGEGHALAWQNKGKRYAPDSRRDPLLNRNFKDFNRYKGTQMGNYVEGSSRLIDDSNLIQHQDNNLRYVMSTSGLNQLKHQNMGRDFSVNEQKMLDAFHGRGLVKENKSNGKNSGNGGSSKVSKARKELIFESENLASADAGVALMQVEPVGG